MKVLDFLNNTNFFNKATFIRDIQCFVFGHGDNIIKARHTKNWQSYCGKDWCVWCGSYIRGSASNG